MPFPLTIGQHLALISKGGLEDALVIHITHQTVGTDLGLGESKWRQTRGQKLALVAAVATIS